MHAPALLAALALAAGPGATSISTAAPSRTATAAVAPAAAREIRTPEGFLRVEGAAFTPGAGSVAFYDPRAAGHVAPPPGASPMAEGTGDALGAAPPPAPPDRCRGERSRYLRRLLQMSGIDLPDPASFLDGLAGRGAYQGAYLFTAYGLLPGADPIRPLAWDLELRSLAKDLAACASVNVPRPG